MKDNKQFVVVLLKNIHKRKPTIVRPPLGLFLPIWHPFLQYISIFTPISFEKEKIFVME